MSLNGLRRRLTPMDAFFLYIERDEEPMSVGSVGIFEGKISFSRFVKSIESRLHLIPRYRQKVVLAPLNIGLPTWEFDPDFDIKNHIFRAKVSPPGSELELNQLAADLFAGPLDRDKPLWEIHVVEGMEGDRTGLFVKVHHCMVDGVAGVGLMMVIFDAWPHAPKVKKQPYKPDPIPSQAQLLYDVLWDSANDTLEHWSRFQKNVNEYTKGKDGNEVIEQLKEFGVTMRDLLSPIKRLPFNKSFSGKRIIVGQNFSFAEARAIRATCGGTVNDVALTILSGAVQRYVVMHGEQLRKRSVRVLVPVSRRQEEERGEMGNRISFLPVDIPLDILDPVERMRIISETMTHLKQSRVSDAVDLMFKALQGTPAPLQNLALSGATSRIGQQVLGLFSQVPPCHMICTNVPGPQIPLYTVGHKLVSYYVLLPVALEMGVSCGITSYDQRLYISMIADSSATPDVGRLMTFLDESFHELRATAQVKERHYVDIPRVVRRNPNPPSHSAQKSNVVKLPSKKTAAN